MKCTQAGRISMHETVLYTVECTILSLIAAIALFTYASWFPFTEASPQMLYESMTFQYEELASYDAFLVL